MRLEIPIDKCKPGMSLADDVVSASGTYIMAKGVVLNELLIEKMRIFGVERVKIEIEDGFKQQAVIKEQPIVTEKPEDASYREFKSKYIENVSNVKSFIHDISIGKNINMDRINGLTDTLCEKIDDNADITKCINDLSDVDNYAYLHSINVSMLSMLIGKWLKFDKEKIKLLAQAGLLHDIGKIHVKKEILHKPYALTKLEFEEIKKHPTYSCKVIQKIPGISKDVCFGVLMHHEREDGSGYPKGLKSEQIHEFGKIIAIADIYDAMTSDRVYKNRETPFEVYETFEREMFGKLDFWMMNVFLNNISGCHVGDRIKLNNGKVGEIVHINPRRFSRPFIKVDGDFIDMDADKNLRIVKLL